MEIKDYYKNSAQWALVLGGSGGIGKACVRKLASQGLHVFLFHKDTRSRAEQLQQELQDWALQYNVKIVAENRDVLTQEAIDAFKQLHEGQNNIKVMVHSVASGNLKPLLAKQPDALVLGESEFRYTTHSMGYSVLPWVQQLYAAQLFSTASSVIGFTSEGKNKVIGNYAAVSAAKAVLESLFSYLAIEFSGTGIRFNLVQPGVTDTEALQKIPGYETLAGLARERNPLKTLTTPENIADIVFLMTTNEARWINGTVIRADGGESLI